MLAAPLCALAAAAAAGPPHPVHVEPTTLPGHPTDYRFVDSAGRERLFRGINVVYKDPPWLPTAKAFNTNFSFVADDAKLLASMGFNLLRLCAAPRPLLPPQPPAFSL